MIKVEVVSVNGSAPPQPMSAAFGEAGGTIGRSPDCTLVLPDDRRAVSRVHARLSSRNGELRIADEGTNPLRLNGQPLGKGITSALRDNDQLSIGPYELTVRMEPSRDAVTSSPVFPPPEPSSGVFGDLLGPAEPAPAVASPFADLGIADAPAAGPSAPPLGQAASPVPAAPRAAPAAPERARPDADDGLTKWFEGIGGAPPGTAVPGQAAAPMPERPLAPPLPPPSAPEPLVDARTMVAGAAAAAAPANRPLEPARAARSEPTPAPRRDRAAVASADLLNALLAGLDAEDLQITQLTPELMHRVGMLLHEATRGTLALLLARGTVKRELRADVTTISSGRNNPLKFSPDARIALRYLLGPQMPGFMDSEQAMRDAYNDLRAHEFAFMAGMRAALAGVLKRFDPKLLEGRVPEKSGIGSLLGANRRAQLWDLFNEHYRQMTQEAEEDFHSVFGREFLKAYEEHTSVVQQKGGRAGR